MVKQNIFFKLIVCLLIWGLLSVNTAFALQSSSSLKKDYLSPRINLSEKSLKKVIRTISRMQVEDALQATLANINEIGERNFKRKLSSEELLVALAMINEGRSLRYIDNDFSDRRKLKQKTMEALSEFIGWSLGFFYWKEESVDSKNQLIVADPVTALSKKQKKQFLKDVENMMRDIIKTWDEQERNLYNSEPIENLTIKIDPLFIDDVGVIVLEIDFSGLLLSSI